MNGNGYSLEGDIPGFKDYIGNAIPENISLFCQSMVLCNDAKLMLDDKGLISKSGLPTEAALKVLCEKIGSYDSKYNIKVDL